jgi:hypothetical protein
MRESSMINSSIQHRYANRSNLALVAYSSRKMISQALASELALSQVETASYLLISLCFKEYCRATSLSIDLFGAEEFEPILGYYHRLAIEYPDLQLLIFSASEIQSILERIGAGIRSIVFSTEEECVELNCRS